jgi:hypothetical protein
VKWAGSDKSAVAAVAAKAFCCSRGYLFGRRENKRDFGIAKHKNTQNAFWSIPDNQYFFCFFFFSISFSSLQFFLALIIRCVHYMRDKNSCTGEVTVLGRKIQEAFCSSIRQRGEVSSNDYASSRPRHGYWLIVQHY